MSVRARIAAIRLIEKMEQNDAYCAKLGLSDVSKFHGAKVNSKTVNKEEK